MGVQIMEWRRSRSLSVIVVTVAVALDAILISVIVPMLPDIMKTLHSSKESISSNTTGELWSINSSEVDQNSQMNYRKQPSVTSINSSYFEAWNPATETNSISGTAEIGLLLSSKAFFEMIASPLIGVLTDRYGYSLAMFIGFFVTFSSTILFAFAESYGILFLARSIQGIGSAALLAPGFGLLADIFPDDLERGRAMSITYAGIIAGVLVGPLFGGIMYQLYGKTVTYLVLATVALIDGCLRFAIAEPGRGKRGKSSTMKELLMDPYILLVLGALFFTLFSFSVLEPILPSWMMTTMNANAAERGLAFFPMTLAILLALNLLTRLSLVIGRYLMAMCGLIIASFTLLLVPLTKNLFQLMVPSLILGLAFGMVECAMIPYLGYLVDLRHVAAYGTVYGLSQFIFCLANVVGAALGGVLVNYIGFEWTLCVVALVTIMYAPLLYFLKSPSSKEEMQLLKTEIKTYSAAESKENGFL